METHAIRRGLGAWAVLLTLMAGFRLLALPAWGQTGETHRRVYAPSFSGGIDWSETAIFWFGRINSTENYVDARVGYNDDILLVHLIVFDRQLWYDVSPTKSDLTGWDSAVLYLSTTPQPGEKPAETSHRFAAQLNPWGPPEVYQAAYRGDGASWIEAGTFFTATTGWRGSQVNGPGDDRGWLATFRIPFSSLGLKGAPSAGTTWRLGVQVWDRDAAEGMIPYTPVWPEVLIGDRPSSWGELVFGLPNHPPPTVPPEGVVTVRHGLDGAQVADAQVGGDTVCGGALDYWTEWGDANYAGSPHLNVQNQNDVADWPCFSKVYLTFPLDGIPPGKTILSATVILHQFGNADGSQALPSWIQALVVSEDWDEQTITWNNAPLAQQNVSGTWVTPLREFPGWPGVRWQWDVSSAVSDAYVRGDPLRLAFYSADTAYHSGKYFVASETGDWNAEARPTLQVTWGDGEGGKPPPEARYWAFLPHLER